MSQLTLVYISLSGNTQSFVKRMSDYLSLIMGLIAAKSILKSLIMKPSKWMNRLLHSYQPTLKVGMVLTMEMLKS